MSCLAPLADPFIGILAPNNIFLTLTPWSLLAGPLLAWTLENRGIRFSSLAYSSSKAYVTSELLRHQVVHPSLFNVILLSFQSMVGLCSFNHGIPRMTSLFGRFATWKVANSLWLLMSISTLIIWVTGPIALGFPSAR